MYATFKVVNAEKVEFEMVIKMSLGDWEKIEKQLSGNQLSWDLSVKIASMIKQAKTQFYPAENTKL